MKQMSEFGTNLSIVLAPKRKKEIRKPESFSGDNFENNIFVLKISII